MGNCCCRAESPCSSVEERSSLLKDESRAAEGDTAGGFACGPAGSPDLRSKTNNEANKKEELKVEAVQVKQSAEAAEMEPNNTQENGPLQKDVKLTATPSPRKGSELKDNSTRAQNEPMNDHPADSRPAELQSTLNPLQKQLATADWEILTTQGENPASVKDKIPDSSSLTAETVCTETHTETKSELVTLDTTPDNDADAVSKVPAVEPSGEFSQNNEVLSVPNTQLTAAACQVSSISVVSQEINNQSLICPVTEDSEGSSVCEEEAGPKVVKSHDISKSSPGSEPTALNHSAEERDAANSVRESETTAPAGVSKSSKSVQDVKPDIERAATSSKEVTSSENIKQDIGEEMMAKGQDEDRDVPEAEEEADVVKEEAESAPAEAEARAGKDAELQEVTGEEEQLAESTPAGVKANEPPVVEKEGLGNSEEDLYRGAEELSASQENKPELPSVLETTLLKLEDRCSLAPAVDILSYSEREWKGNTAKSTLIRKGYKEMSQRFSSLRRVRGDNYCALRATLFQVLSHSTQLPSWLQEEDVTMLPKQLEAQECMISQWTFPGECLQGDGTGDAALQLKGYMELLRKKWQAAVDCSSAVERQQLCEQVFQGGEDELGLLEALKLLMLGRAVELHGSMQGGGDVPFFCWLLFARDSSDCPRSFLSNHLSHVGLSAGLEQVEMFLLGYALQCTIQVYRLYKADTEEFVAFYPDDHKDDWPSVCLVTEDDRHYNVPVVEAAEHKELSSS
ncbi:hypothetical protein L3Q82_018208 [Scortum barcoo]|uniref:Uncharacterized protein n=1 Tax=Scortum barcoo TaxID=214431 RepID=A0ACB8VIM2_9TELE|nr:hypothetical protein L3Q82_018208 [Scortum barcoo]